jgi:hypothetical protein
MELDGPQAKAEAKLTNCSSTGHLGAPTVTLAIAGANFEQKAVLAVVLLYLLVAALVSFPYISRKRLHASPTVGTPQSAHDAISVEASAKPPRTEYALIWLNTDKIFFRRPIAQ